MWCFFFNLSWALFCTGFSWAFPSYILKFDFSLIRWWAKMIQLPRKHYSYHDVTFHPTRYYKKFGTENKYNKTSFLYTSMHEKIYMDKDSFMPKKKKDLLITRNIVTNREGLNCNPMICDCMRLIVVDN
jgi:hypothetical protein